MDPGVLRGASAALGWTPVSARNILDGKEPVLSGRQATAGSSVESRLAHQEGQIRDLNRRLARLEQTTLRFADDVDLDGVAEKVLCAVERQAAEARANLEAARPPQRQSRKAPRAG